MTLASDQQENAFSLSPNAQRMVALRDDVFRTWEDRVRHHIQPARHLERPILVDTLPVFYDNIAESISPGHPRVTAVDGTTVASEHGGERARITSYNHTALIEEYQAFRWALFHVLHEHGVVLDHLETRIVNASIDEGIQQAVEAFSLVHSGFRERFAASLTHDLRGPLSATSAALELILLTNDLTLIKMVAAKALSSTQRMAGMIDELLDTMTFHSGQAIRLDLADSDIYEIAKEVQTDAIVAHGPRVRVEGRSVSGRWDRAALKRVLENLVGNAIKYGDANAPVTIAVNEVHQRLVLSVHNEGPPIPAQEQECIFEMYRRIESAKQNRKQGWGIGLPYVRAVVESHGGSMGLDSGAGRGTTFVVDIPLDGCLRQDAPTLA